MVELNIPLIIRNAPEVVSKWQLLDVEELADEVKDYEIGKIYDMLETGYPRLYIYVMTQLGMNDKV